MKKLSLLFILAITALGIATTSCNAKSSVKLKNDVDSVSYLVGTNMGQYVREFPGEPNIDALIAGLRDAFKKDSLAISMSQVEIQTYMQNFFMAAATKENAKLKAEGEKFLEENKKKDGIQVTASGLQYKVLTEGTGVKPTADQQVRVNYVGKLIDGTEFDKSADHPDPNGGGSVFGVGQVIPGWAEGIQLMSVGSKYMFYIPAELGYGENVRQGSPIKANSVLIFEVELVEILPQTPPEAAK